MENKLLPLGARVLVKGGLFANGKGTIIGIDRDEILDTPYLIHFDNEKLNCHRGEGFVIDWLNGCDKKQGLWVHRDFVSLIKEKTK